MKAIWVTMVVLVFSATVYTKVTYFGSATVVFTVIILTDVVVWIKCIVNNLILHITVVSLELKVLWCTTVIWYYSYLRNTPQPVIWY